MPRRKRKHRKRRSRGKTTKPIKGSQSKALDSESSKQADPSSTSNMLAKLGGLTYSAARSTVDTAVKLTKTTAGLALDKVYEVGASAKKVLEGDKKALLELGCYAYNLYVVYYLIQQVATDPDKLKSPSMALDLTYSLVETIMPTDPGEFLSSVRSNLSYASYAKMATNATMALTDRDGMQTTFDSLHQVLEEAPKTAKEPISKAISMLESVSFESVSLDRVESGVSTLASTAAQLVDTLSENYKSVYQTAHSFLKGPSP